MIAIHTKRVYSILLIMVIALCQIAKAQLVLNATTSGGNAYNVINGKFGGTAIETPDQTSGTVNGSHTSFSARHIQMVSDPTATFISGTPKNVFRFLIHNVSVLDNDVSTGDLDRQRVEMKTYAASPDSLKYVHGETMTATWYFKLATRFQPSLNFTHIHQIKGVDGDDGDPIFTISAYNTSDRSDSTLRVLYVADSSSSVTTLASTSLTPFLGTWVKVVEKIYVDTTRNGNYSVTITKVSDGSTMLSYTNNNIKTARYSNTFVRPKWGIYRSITSASYLRDDTLHIGTVTLYEGRTPAAPNGLSASSITTTQIQLTWNDNSNNETGFYVERSADGTTNWTAVASLSAGIKTYTDANLTPSSTYYYRVSAINSDGNSSFATLSASTAFGIVTKIYYWIGGTSGSWDANTSWNSALDGSGYYRTSALVTDTLVFDGSNIGGATIATGTVTPILPSTTYTINQLKLQNGSNVILQSSVASTVFTINGDGTATNDFTIDATSTLTLGSSLYKTNTFQIVIGSDATALVCGTLYLSPLVNNFHTISYVTASNEGSLVFARGASCYVSDSSSVSGFNSSVDGGVIFNAGASLYYYSGRSPIGTSSTSQIVTFNVGSNWYINGAITGYSSSSWFNQKLLSNVFVQNAVSLTADGSIFKMDTLRIDNGCAFTTHTSGSTPVLGDLIVNGTFTSQSSNYLVMGGVVSQAIYGSGLLSLTNVVVSDNSDVTLANNMSVSGSYNVFGKLTIGASNTISGAGSFSTKVATSLTSLTGTTTAGSYQITGITGLSSSYTGLTVAGTGITSGSTVLGFSSASTYLILSKPATASGTVSLSFTSSVATIATASTSGLDGNIAVAGTKTFTSGSNYIFNGVTTSPFSISASQSSTANNVTFNASCTLNKAISVSGILSINASTLATGANNLTINAATGSAIVSPTAALVISGGTTNFNGRSVLLQSSALGTASLGQISGILSNATNVTVERYIPSLSRKKYTLITSPISGTTIYNAWQEGGANISGYGTHITNTQVTNGFDGPASSAASIFTYNDANASGSKWAALSNTNINTLSPGQGYLVFVRGDRGENRPSTGTSSNTVLRATGTIGKGTIAPTLLTAASKYTLIANPYPCTIDWNSGNLTKTNLTNNFTVYDANLNVFVSSNGTTKTPNVGQQHVSYLQSGQAFFVQNNATTSTHSISFTEGAKTIAATTSTDATVFEEPGVNIKKQIDVNVFRASNGEFYDGTVILFDKKYANSINFNEDILKFENLRGSFASTVNDTALGLNARSDIGTNDTVYFSFKNFEKGAYNLVINAANVNYTMAKLVDTYLYQELSINLSEKAIYNFSISSDSASFSAKRFYISLVNSSLSQSNDVLDNTLSVKISPNPTQNFLRIAFSKKTNEKAVIKVVNMLGQVVHSIDVGNVSQANISLSLEGLSSGYYSIQLLSNGQQIHSQKIMKQ